MMLVFYIYEGSTELMAHPPCAGLKTRRDFGAITLRMKRGLHKVTQRASITLWFWDVCFVLKLSMVIAKCHSIKTV